MTKTEQKDEDKLSTDEQLIILGLLIKDVYVERFSAIAELNVNTVENRLIQECARRLFTLDISEVRMRIERARNVVNSYE